MGKYHDFPKIMTMLWGFHGFFLTGITSRYHGNIMDNMKEYDRDLPSGKSTVCILEYQ